MIKKTPISLTKPIYNNSCHILLILKISTNHNDHNNQCPINGTPMGYDFWVILSLCTKTSFPTFVLLRVCFVLLGG